MSEQTTPAAEPAMSEAMQVVSNPEKGIVEYVPFGAQDKIKLSVAIVINLVAVKTRTGKSCSREDAVKFIAMCQAKHLNPFEGDAFLIGFDSQDGPKFSLVTAHQTYLKRAELNAEYDGMKSGVIVKDEGTGKLIDLEGDFYDDNQRVVGGWATVYFKTRRVPTTRRLKLSTFNKGFGQWKDNPNGMIVKCAEADALRSSFPTMLGGLYMREEIGSTIDVGPSAPRPPAPTAFQQAKIAQLPPPANPPEQQATVTGSTQPVEPEPPQPEPQQAASEPQAPASDKPAFEPSPKDSAEVSELRKLAHESEVSEDQLLAFLLKLKLRRADQKLGDLATKKLKDLAENWGNLLPKIKAG